MYVDWYRTSGREAKDRKATGKTCNCGIPHYPHHRGSVYGCDGWAEAQEKALSDVLEGILTGQRSGVWSEGEPPF